MRIFVERVIKATAFFFIDLSLNNIPNYILQVRIVMQVRVVVLLQNAHRRMRMATKRTTRLQKN